MGDMNAQPMAGALPVAIPANPADRLAALFDAHHDRLYRLARRLSPSADEALDLSDGRRQMKTVSDVLRAADPPVGLPEGADTAVSTYGHLVDCYLEIRRTGS